MKTKLAAVLLASVALAGCDAITAPAATTIECTGDQTECINTWFETKFEEELAFSPIRQTSLGRKTDYDKIDDISVQGVEKQIAWWEQALTDMEANFDYDELSDDAKLSYDMFKWRAEQATKAREFLSQEYILTQMNGLHTALPSFLLSQHTVESESDMEAFIARIGGIGTAMDQALKRAQDNAEAGTRPPRFSYDAVIDESKKLISGAPFDDGEASALWAGAEENLAKLVKDGTITQERADALREETRTALTETMAPAYQRIVEWFKQDRPNTNAKALGATTLPNGEAFYAHSLGQMTTTGMTADEIHELGLADVDRIRGEMKAIMERSGSPS